MQARHRSMRLYQVRRDWTRNDRRKEMVQRRLKKELAIREKKLGEEVSFSFESNTIEPNFIQ